MFWGGAQPIVGPVYERIRMLVTHDIAVYSSHLPLDAHPALGNNVLLAQTLGLEPAGGFARNTTIDVGIRGEADLETTELCDRAEAFARRHGGGVRATTIPPGHRTRRWGICTEAQTLALDTLVVGEGPHHTAVAADEAGLVVIYAGHYATETLGVSAVAEHLTTTFGIPSTFIAAPTGL
jgi:putative NIF3 family GTP cyclohydrolase 1 type 2